MKGEKLKGFYKCRLCGEKFYNCATNSKTASDIVIDICVYGKSKIIQAPGMIGFHSCDDGSLGIADFIGFKKEVEE